MRVIGLLLVVAVAGLACEKNQSPSNGGTASSATSSSSVFPLKASVASASVSNAEGSSSVESGVTNSNRAVALPTGSSAVLAKSAPAVDPEANARGNGAAEPMEDADDGVPVTDRSGAAAPVPEHEGSEGAEIELEE
jgi:hypothetical protein